MLVFDHNFSSGPSISCKAGEDGGHEQTFHLVATDPLGFLVANFSSKEPFFALSDLDGNLTLKISASNSEGNSTGLTLTTGPKGFGLQPEKYNLPDSIPSLSVGPLLGGIIGICILLILLLVLLLVCNLCKAKSPLSTSSCSKREEAKMSELKEEARMVNESRAPDLIPTQQDFKEEEDDPDRDTEEEEDDIYAVVRPHRPSSPPPPTQAPVHPVTCRHANQSGLPPLPHRHLPSFCPNSAHSSISPNFHSTPYYSSSTFCPRAALHTDRFSNSGEMSPYADYLGVRSNPNQSTYNSSLDRSNVSSFFSNRLSFCEDTTHLLSSNPAPVVPQPRRPSHPDVVTLPLESAV